MHDRYAAVREVRHILRRLDGESEQICLVSFARASRELRFRALSRTMSIKRERKVPSGVSDEFRAPARIGLRARIHAQGFTPWGTLILGRGGEGGGDRKNQEEIAFPRAPASSSFGLC